jgi:membrane-bound ClpP family serine protease
MDTLLLWGIALIAGSLLVVLIEAFIPSGGLLSVLAGALAIAGVVCLFRYDTSWGLGGVLGLIILAPVAVGFVLKVWPHTPLGRRIIGAPTEDQLYEQHSREQAERQARAAYVGKEGVVLTDLRPVGLVEIEGKRLEVTSETTFVRQGTRVRVTFADMSQIKVRPLA